MTIRYPSFTIFDKYDCMLAYKIEVVVQKNILFEKHPLNYINNKLQSALIPNLMIMFDE